jgi:cell division protein ZapB
MINDAFSESTEQGFLILQQRLDALITLCQRLADDNRQLQAQCETLQTERRSLIEQNEQSRARIDAMIARLKGLDPST